MTIQDLVREMVKRDSSDIYITAELPSMYRTEGVTEPFGNDKFTPEQTKELAYSTMNDWQKKEFEETKKDFEHKIGICKKESKESKHWLRMLKVCFSDRDEEIYKLWNEAQELTFIFGKIISSMNSKNSAF